MQPAGLYLHIPFCRARCSYCDFATGIYQAPLAERYVRALLTELERYDRTARLLCSAPRSLSRSCAPCMRVSALRPTLK
jgi:hypothetical protein